MSTVENKLCMSTLRYIGVEINLLFSIISKHCFLRVLIKRCQDFSQFCTWHFATIPSIYKTSARKTKSSYFMVNFNVINYVICTRFTLTHFATYKSYHSSSNIINHEINHLRAAMQNSRYYFNDRCNYSNATIMAKKLKWFRFLYNHTSKTFIPFSVDDQFSHL